MTWGPHIRRHLKRGTGAELISKAIYQSKSVSKKERERERGRESIWRDSMRNVGAKKELCLQDFGQLTGTKEAVCSHYPGLWLSSQHFSLFVAKRGSGTKKSADKISLAVRDFFGSLIILLCLSCISKENIFPSYG